MAVSPETVRAISEVRRSRRALECTCYFFESLQSGIAPRKVPLIIQRGDNSSLG